MTEDEMREQVAREIASINEMDPDEDWPRFEDDACAILSIAIPWAREQALREAARKLPSGVATWPTGAIQKAILALIPARPSQETPNDN